MPTTYVPVSSLFSVERTATQELLGNRVTNLMQGDDHFMRDCPISSFGLSRDPISRDLQTNLLYVEPSGGVVENGRGVGRGDFPLYGEGGYVDVGTKGYRVPRPTKTWPDPLEGYVGKPFRFTLPMRSLLTDFPMWLSLLDYNLLEAATHDLVQSIIDGFAVTLSRRLCIQFWLDQDENYKLSDLGPSTGTGSYVVDTTARTITFSPSHEAIARFSLGDRVDLWSNTGASSAPERYNQLNNTATPQTGTPTESNRVRCFVSHVEEDTNTVVLSFPDTTSADGTQTFGTGSNWSFATFAGALDELAYVTWANNWADATNKFQDIAGVHSYLKTVTDTSDAAGRLLGNEAVTGGTDPALGGAVHVGEHPFFRSYKKDMLSQVLTEHDLNLNFDAFYRKAKKWGQFLDRIETTAGVMRAYQKNHEAKAVLERSGPSSLAQEGTTGEWVFLHDGRRYVFNAANQFIAAGRLYGLRMGGGNWQIAVPPMADKKTGKGVKSWIPFSFVGHRLTGGNADYMPYLLTGSGTAPAPVNPSEFVRFPGMVKMQVVCRHQTRMLLMTNLKEEKVYSD